PLTGCSASGLPAGLSIGFVAGECRLSGTPTAIAPSANYTVSATNAGGTITTSISITVNDVVPSALAYAGSPFTLTQSTAMTAATSTHSGGAITACLAASLPSGLAVNLVSGECEISGTPTSASASASYPVTASNSGGSVTSNISITVNSAVVAPGSLAFAGAPFTLTVNTAMTSVASTHTGSAITSCSGTLPAGLTLTLTSGECVLAGSPTSISTATNYTLTGTNSAGSTPKVVNITVNDAAPTTLAYAGAPFTFIKNSAITAASSTHLGGTITGCSAPGLPTGLSVSLVSGECQLSGTPTAVTSGANYTFSAINSGGTATASVSIIVNDIALTSLAFAGSPFSFTQSSAIIAANSTHSGGTITTCTGSSLPAGLSMSVVSGECQLSGTPTASSTIANYTITAGNSAGTTTASISITVNAATLAAPTGLAATGASLSVGLSWTQASGTTGYKVYRKASASVTTADSVICNVTPGTTTSCTDSTVAAGTTYYYAITSVNGGSESAISTSVSALTLPAAPTGLLAGPGNLKNMISWSAVAGAASYTVKRGASGGPYSTTVTCSTSTATSCTETGLTNGTSYYYVVIANNATGAGPASVQITSVPVASNKLGFVVSPGGQTYSSGVSFSPSITVAVKNTGGTTMTTTTNAITLFLSINTVGGTITGTLTRNAVNGVATFDDIKLDALATNYQMRASSTGLISAPTTTAFSIIAGPATQISLSSIFSLTNTCNGPFTIQALDANNNPSANNSSGSAWAVSLSKSTGSASFYASTDPTCAGSTVSSASIAIGANSTSFYVKDTAADTFTLTANGSGSGIGSKSTNLIIHAAAPRSRFIYTADANINAISILKIDANGKPTTYKSATVGIYQNMDLAIDPQNRFLFIADNNYTAYVYAINPLTGLLTLNSSINTVRPINKMVTDPAGKWLYISTDTGVRMYNINQTTGALTSMSPALVTGSTYPSSLAMDPLGRFVYETGNNMVFQYVINSSTGVLTANSPASITTVSSETISIDPTGTYLYVAASSSSGIYQYSISNSGTLVPLSPATISSGFGPTSIIQDTFGRFIYSGDSPNNLLYSFKASSATGVLTPTSPANLTIQSGPYPLAVDSQGKYLFIAAQGSSLLVALTIDQTTGVPTANGNASTGGQTNAIVTANPIKPADPATYMTLNRAPMKVNTCSGPFTLQAMGADEEISDPNGSGSNWTINLSSDTGNAVFYAGTDTTCTGSTVTSVNIAPASTSTSFYLKDATAEILTLTANGIGAGLGNLNSKLRVRGAGAANRFAYQFVGNAGSPIIAEYVVNTDGSLTANSTPTYALTGSPYSISIDPLGRFVYVNSGATFTTLKIDPTTGVLTPSATYTTTDSTTPFFNFTVSANGQYGYSIGDSSNGYILGWSVNATTGAITPNGVQSPYIGSNSLALLGEPLGEHLYLLDTYGGLSVIDLNTANGQISGQQYQPVRIYVAGYPSKIAIDPDGRYLYETYTSGEVGMYKINADGSLTLLSPVTINAGLNPSGIAVDTNGSFAYVVNRDDGTMSMFQINQANGTLTLISLGTPTVATGGLPTSAATDNQGKFAYCLNTNDGSISSFAVNQTNGLLTFISTTTGLGIKAVMSFGFSI
ncbi:MAG: beta-propeller fold lactonase family protein, partial [Bdellovibrionales bacterium]|nr:beta-propeller fold lactonase family protein [Oligoflexia bacterium]